MKLTKEGIRETAAWQKAGITLPPYDVEAVTQRAVEAPGWVHFGIGNIFRVFIGGIADSLIREGEMDRGITCVETFDYDVVDQIYAPFDNLSLSVTLFSDGHVDKRVIGALAEAVKADNRDEAAWNRLKEIFVSPSLQIVSFTITEKGYALRGSDGEYLNYVKADLENGPDHVTGAMGIVTALLYERFRAGGCPVALVSMDNVSHNGDKLKASVKETASVWAQKNLADPAFLSYVNDEKKVSFPITMIDKITPRPSTEIADALEQDGLENMQPVITSKRTYIAPFVNAEKPQYLVVEDSFPNGRPALEKAGVYMADRDTVNKSERMKVTVCLNPVHSALGPYGVLLGHEYFADNMSDPELLKLANLVSYHDGFPVLEDPGILSPEAFMEELMQDRFPNVYLGDTSMRMCVDESMGVPFRFGETIKAYVAKDGNACALKGIPVALAGWLRYFLAVDDEGTPYELASDPLADEITSHMEGIVIGQPESVGGKLRPILSNERIFGIDLYEAGIGEKIEEIYTAQTEGKGAVRAALKKYLAD